MADQMASDPLGTEMWRFFFRLKSQLPAAERLENLSWRRMAIQLRKMGRLSTSASNSPNRKHSDARMMRSSGLSTPSTSTATTAPSFSPNSPADSGTGILPFHPTKGIAPVPMADQYTDPLGSLGFDPTDPANHHYFAATLGPICPSLPLTCGPAPSFSLGTTDGSGWRPAIATSVGHSNPFALDPFAMATTSPGATTMPVSGPGQVHNPFAGLTLEPFGLGMSDQVPLFGSVTPATFGSTLASPFDSGVGIDQLDFGDITASQFGLDGFASSAMPFATDGTGVINSRPDSPSFSHDHTRTGSVASIQSESTPFGGPIDVERRRSLAVGKTPALDLGTNSTSAAFFTLGGDSEPESAFSSFATTPLDDGGFSNSVMSFPTSLNPNRGFDLAAARCPGQLPPRMAPVSASAADLAMMRDRKGKQTVGVDIPESSIPRPSSVPGGLNAGEFADWPSGAIEPTTMVLESTAMALESTAMVVEPTAMVIEPTAMVIEPTAMVIEPSGMAVEPNQADEKTTGSSTDGLNEGLVAEAGESSRGPISKTANHACANCHTGTTSLWRRDDEGRIVCNACALFFKSHGTRRPLSLKTEVIRRRNRNPHTGGRVRKTSTLGGNGMTLDESLRTTGGVPIAPQPYNGPARARGELLLARHPRISKQRRRRQGEPGARRPSELANVYPSVGSSSSSAAGMTAVVGAHPAAGPSGSGPLHSTPVAGPSSAPANQLGMQPAQPGPADLNTKDVCQMAQAHGFIRPSEPAADRSVADKYAWLVLNI